MIKKLSRRYDKFGGTVVKEGDLIALEEAAEKMRNVLECHCHEDGGTTPGCACAPCHAASLYDAL
jgi:hypothetical protein